MKKRSVDPSASLALLSGRCMRLGGETLTVHSLVRRRDPAGAGCQDRLNFFKLVGVTRDEDYGAFVQHNNISHDGL